MKSILLFVAISLVSISSFAQDAGALRKKHFNLDAGIAISGIMSYFGGEDEEAPKKQEEMIGNTQQKNFKAEQDDGVLQDLFTGELNTGF